MQLQPHYDFFRSLSHFEFLFCASLRCPMFPKAQLYLYQAHESNVLSMVISRSGRAVEEQVSHCQLSMYVLVKVYEAGFGTHRSALITSQ